MDKRVALIGILVENMDSVPALNTMLHAHYKHIIGRMGLPYREKDVHVISIAVDAPEAVIKELTDGIRTLDGVTLQVTCSTVCDKRS